MEQLLGGLASLIERGDKDGSMVRAEELLGLGVEPSQIVKTAVAGALGDLNDKYSGGEASPEDMIAAGRAAKSVLAILEHHFSIPGRIVARSLVLVGTIEGDIHDLGKEVLAIALRTSSAVVIDLGAGVPVQEAAAAVRSKRPAGLALSCHVTACLPTLQQLIDIVKGLQPPLPIVLVGGSALDAALAHSLGADLFAGDALQGVAELSRILR